MANKPITGTVQRVIRAPRPGRNGWCIFALSPDSEQANHAILASAGKGSLKCVGNLPAIEEGRRYKLTGHLSEHPIYGPQFRFRNAELITQDATIALDDYLLNLAPNIEAADLRATLSRFGQNRLVKALDDKKSDALSNHYLSKQDAKRLVTVWHSAQSRSRLRSTCARLGFPDSAFATLAAHFEKRGLLERASQVLRRNPFVVSPLLNHPYPMLALQAKQLGIDGAPDSTDSAIGYVLTQLAEAGHTCQPRGLLIKSVQLQDQHLSRTPPSTLAVDDRINKLSRPNGMLSVLKHRSEEAVVALQNYAVAEQHIAERLAHLYSAPISVLPSLDRALAACAQDAIQLTSKQSQAIAAASKSKIFLLTGDPGTGKTAITKYLLAGYPDDVNTLLLAPTGQAAARLAESTQQAAYTIASALQSVESSGGYLDADLILVDELSMVSAVDGARLLSVVPDNANLVMSGDPEQLPSIGAGNILRDLANSWLPHVHLNEVVRQDKASGILTVAANIKQGLIPFAASNALGNDAFHVDVASDDPGNLGRQIQSVVRGLIQRNVPHDKIQVLLPTKISVQGTQHINELLRPLLNSVSPTGGPGVAIANGVTARAGDRVRHLRNDYPRGVHNGMVGYVSRVNTTQGSLVVDYGNHTVSYRTDQAGEELDLSYAATVHSSQGSEYPAVVLGLGSKHTRTMTRGLLYTAATRASSWLMVVSEPGAMQQAIMSDPARGRHTRLLYEMARNQPASLMHAQLIDNHDSQASYDDYPNDSAGDTSPNAAPTSEPHSPPAPEMTP